MDSKQNPSFENVRVKVEPGTSSAPLAPPAGSTRLTSFRPARDLTLGGIIKTEKTTKKVYTPNVNVQRNKKKDDGSAVKTEPTQKAGGRGRGKGAGERGRGRGKGSSNYVQMPGVFSEGMSGDGRSTRRSSSFRNGTSTGEREPKVTLEKSTLNMNLKYDKDEEEKKVELLKRDDFIDDGDNSEQANPPIVLPLINQGKLYEEAKVEKNEVSDEEEEESDRKPIILENGQAMMPLKKLKKIKKKEVLSEDQKCPKTVPQIVDDQSTGYLLVTFPDCLPGVHSTDAETDPRVKKNDVKPPETPEPTTPGYCTLHTLKDGPLGKIQIHKSGKAILRLGDNSLVIDVGSRQSFRQDLIAAEVDESNSQLVNLGQVTSTLICSPDWESMLASL